MKKNFDRAVEFTLRWEGGLVNDPNDPGGLTNYGISKRKHPDVDVENLSLQGAKDIYYKFYWVPMGCDSMEFPLDMVAFDTAVNCGVERTQRWLNGGSNTIALIFRRLSHYANLCAVNKKFNRYLYGWLRRVLDLYSNVTKGVM